MPSITFAAKGGINPAASAAIAFTNARYPPELSCVLILNANMPVNTCLAPIANAVKVTIHTKVKRIFFSCQNNIGTKIIIEDIISQKLTAMMFTYFSQRFTTQIETIACTTQEIKDLIVQKDNECPYGLCLIASDRRTLRFYEDLEKFGCDLFYPSSRNLANALIVSPAPDADLSGFKDVVFLDTPSDFNVQALQGKRVYVNEEICGYKMFEGLDTARESLLEIFSALRKEIHSLSGATAEELAISCDGLGFDMREFIFAVNVFEELGLISFEDGKFTVYRGVKAELTDSSIYRKICNLQEV